MSNIIQFNGKTNLDIDPDLVLDEAKGELKTALLIGIDHDGECYDAASTGSKSQLLWMIEQFKFKLISGEYDE